MLKKKNKVGGLTIHDFKTYSEAIKIKNMWHWQKDGHIDKWNRIESQDTDYVNTANWFLTSVYKNSMEKELSFRQMVMKNFVPMQKNK